MLLVDEKVDVNPTVIRYHKGELLHFLDGTNKAGSGALNHLYNSAFRSLAFLLVEQFNGYGIAVKGLTGEGWTYVNILNQLFHLYKSRPARRYVNLAGETAEIRLIFVLPEFIRHDDLFFFHQSQDLDDLCALLSGSDVELMGDLFVVERCSWIASEKFQNVPVLVREVSFLFTALIVVAWLFQIS